MSEPIGAPARRTRLRDPDAIRRRAEGMLRRKLAGYSMAEIAAEHHPTVRHVRRELAGLSEADRRRAERAFRDELLGPGGWKLLR